TSALVGTAIAVFLGVSACGGGSAAPSAAGSAAPLHAVLPAKIRSAGHIVLGSELTVPPMTFRKPGNAAITGVNYDLAQAMGKQLGVTMKFKQLAFPGLQPALKSGQIDAIFDVINDTKQRERQLTFVDYVKSGNTLLLKDGNPDKVHSMADLCGHTVATVRGSVQIALVTKQSSQCTSAGRTKVRVQQYPSAESARLQVQNGKATAFIGNTPVLVYLAKTAKNGKAFDAVPIKAAQTSYYGIALARSDTQLRSALTQALAAVMKQGTYSTILRRYGVQVVAMDKPLVDAAAG
ncbi:MAG: ABC transporter substrate-binding protein, partial [Sciscionella sp.]